MYNTMSQTPTYYVKYVDVDSVDNLTCLTYNIPIGNNVGDIMQKDDGIFRPSKEELEAAKIRLQERLRTQQTTKGYAKYFKKLMKSYRDIRINE